MAQVASEAGAPGKENTLGTESTIRIRHLLGKIGEAYYENRHRLQEIEPGGAARADRTHASPESTLKIMLYAKYLFLEIWKTGLLDMPAGEILEEMKVAGYPSLADILWQDAETKRLVETMRHQFSAHAYFSLEETIKMIENPGFERFWRVTRRILLFKDAVTVVRYDSGSLGNIADRDPDISLGHATAPADGKMEEMRARYAGPMLGAKWSKKNPRVVMQECTTFIRMLRDELQVASALHSIYRTRHTLERLVAASYDSVYMIAEMHDFIRRYRMLKIPLKPGFLDRKKKYKDYRDQYCAHEDKEGRITSIMELYGDTSIPLSALVLDMEEAILVSRRLFPEYVPGARIRIPTLSRITEIEEEYARVWKESHRRLGNRFLGSRYERDCALLRSRVDRKLGLR